MAHNPTVLFGNLVSGAHFPGPGFQPGFDPEFAHYTYDPFAPGPDATAPGGVGGALR